MKKLIILFLLLFASCNNIKPKANLIETKEEAVEKDDFVTSQKKENKFATGDLVDLLSEEVSDEYLLGPGDRVSLRVWNRQEISYKNIIVGPDGMINIIRIGIINVNNRTRIDVQEEIRIKLAKYYQNPEVTLEIEEYTNNRAFVLGRVTNPGIVKFPGKGTLLEALSLAGGLPVLDDNKAPLTECAILRGNEKIIWIDLKDLLYNGNMLLNARIQNNDVIFIPESGDTEYVYLMGQVMNTGVVRLTDNLTVLDAIMQVGGLTEDANSKEIYIIRLEGNGQSVAKEVNLKALLEEGDISQNYVLNSKDVVFVSEKGIASWNYIMKNILPTLQVLDLSQTISKGTVTIGDIKIKE